MSAITSWGLGTLMVSYIIISIPKLVGRKEDLECRAYIGRMCHLKWILTVAKPTASCLSSPSSRGWQCSLWGQCVGSMVADVHRTLVYGGIFPVPSRTQKSPKGSNSPLSAGWNLLRERSQFSFSSCLFWLPSVCEWADGRTCESIYPINRVLKLW